MAFYANGTASFEHQDWLGTERLRTTYNGGVEGTYQSLPWGDGQSFSGSDQDAHHYATLDYDSESNTDHAQFRQYSSTEGRFLSPDPYGGSYDPTNPQSFNRYEYAMDNPLSNIDPSGLQCDPWNATTWTADEDGGGCVPGVGGFGGAGAGGVGGYGGGMGHYVWFPNWQHICDDDNGDVVNCRDVDEGNDVWIATGPLMNFTLASFAYGSGGDGGGAPNNGEPPSTCLAANIAAVNQVSNLNVNMNNVVGQPFIYNGGLDVNFSVPGGSPSQLPAGRYPSSFLNSLFGIGSSLHVPGPGGSDPSTYGMSNGNFTFTTHIDSAYSTWHTPLGALIHFFVDVRDHGAHRGPC